MVITQEPDTGLYYRPDVDNILTIIKEQKDYKKLPSMADEVVLDIGAHIGVFAYFANLKKAKQVICVEPDDGNLHMLHKNYFTNMTIIGAACVHQASGPVKLYQSKKKSSMHSLIPKQHRTVAEVPTVNFKQLLQSYSPTVIKIDIEGGEFDLTEDLCNLPDYVKAIAIEMHYLRNEENLDKARRFTSAIEQKLQQLKKPNLSGKYYQWDTTVGVWSK
jgi:FkbM family methyltransferase